MELREEAATTGRWSLTLAAVTSLLASMCCVLPLVLVLLGFSGAWMIHMRAIRPYSSVLIAISTLALVYAWKPVFCSAARCGTSGLVGARPRRVLRVVFVVISAFTATLLLVPLIAPLFY
jgi:mercuric ion transport protein